MPDVLVLALIVDCFALAVNARERVVATDETPAWGFFTAPHVTTLQLNIALDAM